MFKDASMDAVFLTHNIDSPFITQLEQSDDKVRFVRIDSDVNENFTTDSNQQELDTMKEGLTNLFSKVLNNEKLEVKVLKLKNEKLSSLITLSEESRRMQDMMKMYNMYGMDPSTFGSSETLVLNANHSLVQYVLNHEEDGNTPMLCEQLYDLAMISHKPLAPEAMTKFVERSNEIMKLLMK
jgi:molecular chaperone HtpG